MNTNIPSRLMPVAALLIFALAFFAGRYATNVFERDPARIEAVALQDFKEGNAKAAFPLFKKLAEKGDETAAYYLGEMYQFGDGTKADGEEAIKWLTVAAKAGNAKGQRQLGLVYLEGAIAVQDFREARKWLELAADEGDEIALRNLGDMSKNGLGAAADPVLAYAYYSAAAIRGSDYGTVMRDKIVTSLSAAQQREGEEKAQAILAKIAGNAAKHDSPAAPKPPKSGTSNDS